MKRHTIIYFDFFGYDISSFIPCEICGEQSVDIHHIEARGMGGDPSGSKDVVENLMAICRYHHEKYEGKRQYKEYLKKIHNEVIDQHLLDNLF